MTAGQQKSLNAYKQRKAWWGSCECHDTGQGHLRIVGTRLIHVKANSVWTAYPVIKAGTSRPVVLFEDDDAFF